jgi:hypothetical protein
MTGLEFQNNRARGAVDLREIANIPAAQEITHLLWGPKVHSSLELSLL